MTTPVTDPAGLASAELLKRVAMAPKLSQALGDFHLTAWDEQRRVLRADFTVRPEHCHSDGRIAQGGFVTGWLDGVMAFAVILETGGRQTVHSLEIKVSFLERVSPGEGYVEGRVVRRGRRVAFVEGWLYNAQGQLAAQASSSGMLTDVPVLL